MEPLRLSRPEVREIFGDSDSKNEDDFAGFLADDIDVNGHGDNVMDDNDDNSDSDNDSELGQTEDMIFGDASAYDCWWLRVFDMPVGPANIQPETVDYGLFQLFFTDSLVDTIVTETN